MNAIEDLFHIHTSKKKYEGYEGLNLVLNLSVFFVCSELQIRYFQQASSTECAVLKPGLVELALTHIIDRNNYEGIFFAMLTHTPHRDTLAGFTPINTDRHSIH